MIGYEALTKTKVRMSTDKTSHIHFPLKPTVIGGREVIVVAEKSVI
jgi:hypothetical protein